MLKLIIKGLLLLTCVSLVGCVEDTEAWNNGYSVAPNNSTVAVSGYEAPALPNGGYSVH